MPRRPYQRAEIAFRRELLDRPARVAGADRLGRPAAAGGRSYTVIGDAVNSAARLETAAPVGEVAIGAATLRELPGARTRALGAIEVKGRREPLDAYVLEALASG
jgi:class 3 adenylate cyclase